MIEHKPLAGVTIYEAGGLLQLPIANQEIIGEIAAGELGDAAVEAALVEEAFRLGLHNLSYADQLGVVRKLVECGRQALCKQRGPAYDSTDRITLTCTAEQPMRLLQAPPGLHGDRRIVICQAQHGLEFIDEEVAAQRSHGLLNPLKFRGRVSPQVVMSVDTRLAPLRRPF